MNRKAKHPTTVREDMRQLRKDLTARIAYLEGCRRVGV